MASTLEVYERMRSHLGEDDSRLLLEFVQDVGTRGIATQEDIVHLETKIDHLEAKMVNLEAKMVNLEAKMVNLEAKMEVKIEAETAKIEGKLKAEMANLEISLRAEIAQVKTDLLKWLFLFWAGQIAVIAGLIRLIQ